MAANICQRLMGKVWRKYANDLDKAPAEEGIYTIGFIPKNEYVYVGHSKDIQRRLKDHKSNLEIDKFVKMQFRSNDARDLRIKWVQNSDGACAEGEYLECMAKKLGYWPQYNMKRGNFSENKSAASICQRLIKEDWKSYANDLNEAPEAGGIYAIDFRGKYFYVGHSNNIRRRLGEHKYKYLDIDEFIDEQFNKDSGINLGIKWKEENEGNCVEDEYLECMEKKLGYWPRFNKKRGNTCN